MGDKTKVIEVRHLQKSFGANEVLKDINFDVSEGEVVCVIGSSGSGKSTLLRCINLLEIASSGEIYYRGESIHGGRSPAPSTVQNWVWYSSSLIYSIIFRFWIIAQ